LTSVRVRSMMSLVVVGLIVARYLEHRAVARVAIVLAAVPVTVAINAFRVSATAVATQYYGISAAVGVYVAMSVEALGANVPAPPLHVPLEAPPPMTPANCTAGAAAHTVRSAPASAVATGWMTMRMSSLATAHGPPVATVVSVSVTPPAAISAGVGS